MNIHRARIALGVLLAAVSGTAFAFLIGPPPFVDVHEYTNDLTGHYVLLNEPQEISAVEGGAAGPGWRFTGYVFSVAIGDTSAQEVCRFYSPGANSHFFTAEPGECASLKRPGSGWIFEGTPFRARVPVDGACASGYTAVYRQYNNRAPDANHRFDFDSRVRTRMASRGWVDEGIAFCSDHASRRVQGSANLTTGLPISVSCEQAAAGIESSCIEAYGLPPLTSKIDRTVTVNPPYVLNPGWSPELDARVGWATTYGQLATFGATVDPASVAGRTFVIHGDPAAGFLYNNFTWLGIHLNGEDRIAGDYASVAIVHHFPTADPAPGAMDSRLRPWVGPRDSDLHAGFATVALKSVRRPAQNDHGYGVFGIRLKDTTSGGRVQVNLLAYGSLAPGDFTGRDVRTGYPIVATTFGPVPGFGRAAEGSDYVPCSPECGADQRAFNMTIGLEDAQVIVSRARGVDPGLSPNPGDYVVERFECRAETYRDAQLAATIANCGLQMTY